MTSARLRSYGPLALLGLLAFAVRETLALRGGGGFHSNYGYDTSVYYAAADALLHGRIPYRDFILLHPPGAMLVLTPAALLGHLTSDHVGFASANLAFTAIGALNAVLVALAAVRWGCSRRSALLGGAFYATWLGAVEAEFACRLEPLGNAALLTGLLLLAPGRDGAAPGRRRLVGAGLAIGFAASTKIWFVVPALAVLVWLVVRYRRAAVLVYAAGVGAALAVVDLPFLILSHGAMFARIVLDQLGRRAIGRQQLRWSSLATVSRLPGHPHSAALLILATVVLGGVVLLALSAPAGRFLGVLAVLHGAVLLLSPSWFGFYADFAAAPLALAVAVAAEQRRRAVPGVPLGRLVAGTAVAGALAGSVAVLVAGSAQVALPWRNVAALQSLVRRDRCVMADSPAGLIELDRLDSDLARGCPLWVDTTGRTYFGVDRWSGPRNRNRRWQLDLIRYLHRGGAAFVVRAAGDGLTAADRRRLAQGSVRIAVPGGVLYQRIDPGGRLRHGSGRAATAGTRHRPPRRPSGPSSAGRR